MRYFGGFSGPEDIARDFEINDGSGPTDAEILFAAYEGGSYEGDALVIFERDGKLYEVHGSHCSCYGLEGQWSPEETSWEAIKMRPALDACSYEQDTRDAFEALRGSH